MGYDAFISYAYDADGAIASSLNQALGRYAKPWWQRRSLSVFQDRSSLTANPAIWPSIVTALDEAEWLVLLASPEAAASDWVNREIAHWVQTKGTERIIPVLTHGDWTWDRAGQLGLSGDAVPRTLHDAYADEPRYVDLRWARQPSTAPETLNLRNQRFRDQIAEIAAPIRGLRKDEIEGVDLREHRRNRRTVAGAIVLLAVLTIASVTTGAIAVHQTAVAKARTSDDDFTRLVAQSAALRTSNAPLAMLLAVEAHDLRNNAASRSALLAAVSANPSFNGEIVDRGPGFSSVCVTNGGATAVAGSKNGTIVFYDLRRRVRVGTPIRLAPQQTSPAAVACSRQGSTVAAYDASGYWTLLDVRNHRPVGPPHRVAGIDDLKLSPDGSTLAISLTNAPVALIPVTSAGVTGTIQSGAGDNGATGLAFSPDGKTLATVSPTGGIDLFNLTSRTHGLHVDGIATGPTTPRAPSLRSGEDISEADFSPDGHEIAVLGGAFLRMIDTATGKVRWSQRTAWWDGAPLRFTDGGHLLADVNAGELQELNASDGDSDGDPIVVTRGNTVSLAVSGSIVLAASDTTSVLSLVSLNGASPVTRAIPVATGSELAEYDPSGTSLLVDHQLASGPLFVLTQALHVNQGNWGPVLRPLAQPRFVAPHTVGGIETNFQIGYVDSRNNRLVGPHATVPLVAATSAALDLRSRRIAMTRSTGTVDLFSQTGRVLAAPWVRPGGYPLLSTDGFAADGSVAVYNQVAGNVIVLDTHGKQRMHLATHALMATLTPDGRLLAVLRDVHVELFNVRTQRKIGNDIQVPAGSSDIEFSHNGSRMLVFGVNGGEVFDVASHQPIGAPFSSNGYVALRPDGRQLATTTTDHVLLWDLDANNWQRTACLAAGRNMTRQEWSTYMPSSDAYRATCPQWPLPKT